MTAELVDYLLECPCFEGAMPCINFLDAVAGSVSVKKKNQKRNVRSYIDGGQVVSDTFVVSIRDDFGYAAGQRNGSRPDSQGCRY